MVLRVTATGERYTEASCRPYILLPTLQRVLSGLFEFSMSGVSSIMTACLHGGGRACLSDLLEILIAEILNRWLAYFVVQTNQWSLPICGFVSLAERALALCTFQVQ